MSPFESKMGSFFISKEFWLEMYSMQKMLLKSTKQPTKAFLSGFE